MLTRRSLLHLLALTPLAKVLPSADAGPVTVVTHPRLATFGPGEGFTTLWIAPAGEPFPDPDVTPAGNWMLVGTKSSTAPEAISLSTSHR